MRFAPFALQPAAFEDRRKRLTWGFHKWDSHVSGRETVARGAIVLSAREHAELAAASEALFALTEDALARFMADPNIDRTLGVPDGLRALATTRSRSRITRIDWFWTANGWVASEWNDDAPGGFNDALGLVALFADAAASGASEDPDAPAGALRAVEKGLEPAGDLPEALLRLLAPPGTRRVGLAYATAYAEDLQVVRLLADLVESQGIETTLASPAHLAHENGRTTLAGDDIDTLYRFFPAEWFPSLSNLDTWQRAIAAGLRVVNPLACAWSQSKASFALALVADDPRARGRLPGTRLLTPDTRADALAEPHRWVLKPAFGRMGEGVVLGGDRPADEWRKALDGALRRPLPSVLQERFHPLPLEIAPGATATPCIGAYVVEGRFAGYYSRIARGSVVRHDASNVLTLLETV